MVNKEEIRKNILDHVHIDAFVRDDEYVINDDGTVDINGDVIVRHAPHGELPIKFGKVSGDFTASYVRLVNLNNAPVECGYFNVMGNKLTDLKGCPATVDGIIARGNPLVSLEGIPAAGVDGEIYVDYSLDLPLLRLLLGELINLGGNNAFRTTVRDVLGPYAGQGRRGAIQAARDLIKAGEAQGFDHNPFERNARW
jgi:hypothetical protein